LTRVIRAWIAFLLLVILVAIARYFMDRSSKEGQVAVNVERPITQKIEKREGVKHSETKAGEETLNVKAEKYYWGEDNLNHWEGNVEIVFLKKREGKDVILSGDKVAYDKDQVHFVLSGRAKVEFKDLVIESVLLHYDSKEERYWTESGVSFSSTRLKGSARKMAYLMREEKVELHDKIELLLKPKLETSFPFIARGNDLHYSRTDKTGMMEGDVQLSHGESRGSADIMEFELSPDEEFVKTLILKGKKDVVRASLVDEGKKNVSSRTQPPFVAQSVKREVEAEEITLHAFPNLSTIQAVEAGGKCDFKFIASSGAFTNILGDTLKFEFDEEGGLRNFQASKDARMIDQGESPEDQRHIGGDTLSITGDTDILEVKGKGPFEAAIAFPDTDILAEEFTVFLDSKNLEVRKGVKVVLKPKKGEENPIGIFSKDYPVFVRAREMRYFDEQKRFLFKGSIKAWQEKKILLADEIELQEETGKIICTGGAKSILPHKAKEENREKRADISSGRMVYEPEENIIFYEENCALKFEDIDIQAQTISVCLNEEREGMKEIIARGNVVVLQNLGEARGEEARYVPDKESIVVIGNPTLIDKDKGITKGDKLTFYIADGRILVENKGKERSETVIKRDK
jgi:lipopolysaccharide transport protein LptA